MKAKRRIALAQCAPRLGDVEHNLKLHLQWAEEAAAGGADLCIFPELSLTGYLLKDMVSEIAMSHDDKRWQPLLDASRQVALVVGVVAKDADFRYYNAAAYLSGGAIRHIHRKVYLPTYGMFDEGRYFAEGDRVRAFDCDGVGAGILICEDMWHLSAAYLLAAQGVHLLVCPSVSPGRGVLSSLHIDDLRSVAAWDDLCRTIAEFTTTYVVYCNRIGYEDGVTFHGGSSVHGPDGRQLLAAEQQEGLQMADIDLREVERQRVATPLLRDEKFELTLRELQRTIDERTAGPY
jgi:predicted amidohydrolase